jgi:hypothetical protein
MELLALENLKGVSEEETLQADDFGELTPWRSPASKWQTARKTPPRKYRKFNVTMQRPYPVAISVQQSYERGRSPALIRISHPFSFSEHKDETMKKLYERL